MSSEARNTDARRELATGWPIIVAAGIGVLVGLTGIPYYTFGTFLKPLATAFGWSRSEVSLGVLFLHSGTFFISPFLGGFIDRHGARRIALLSLVGLAVGFCALALLGPSLSSYYGAWVLVAVLGCGTTPLTWSRMIATHFIAARGLALGLALAGTGVAALLGPQLCHVLIAAFGWRAGYVGLAAIVLFVALPVVALATRGIGATTQLTATLRHGLTLREAARTRSFWSILAAIFLIIFAQAAATVHLVPLLTDGGISPALATGLAGLLGIAVIVGRPLTGFLLDRYFAPYVGACFLVLPVIALPLLAGHPSVATATIAVLLLGLAAGAEVDLLAFLTSRYFGLAHFGKIYGVALSAFALGAGIGPAVAGHAFDVNGGYRLALFVGAGMFAIGALLIASLGRYPDGQPPSRTGTASYQGNKR